MGMGYGIQRFGMGLGFQYNFASKVGYIEKGNV